MHLTILLVIPLLIIITALVFIYRRSKESGWPIIFLIFGIAILAVVSNSMGTGHPRFLTELTADTEAYYQIVNQFSVSALPRSKNIVVLQNHTLSTTIYYLDEPLPSTMTNGSICRIEGYEDIRNGVTLKKWRLVGLK